MIKSWLFGTYCHGGHGGLPGLQVVGQRSEFCCILSLAIVCTTFSLTAHRFECQPCLSFCCPPDASAWMHLEDALSIFSQPPPSASCLDSPTHLSQSQQKVLCPSLSRTDILLPAPAPSPTKPCNTRPCSLSSHIVWLPPPLLAHCLHHHPGTSSPLLPGPPSLPAPVCSPSLVSGCRWGNPPKYKVIMLLPHPPNLVYQHFL